MQKHPTTTKAFQENTGDVNSLRMRKAFLSVLQMQKSLKIKFINLIKLQIATFCIVITF